MCVYSKKSTEFSQCKIIQPCSCFIHAVDLQSLIACPGRFLLPHNVCFSFEQNNVSQCLPSDVYGLAQAVVQMLIREGARLNPGGLFTVEASVAP